MHYLLSYQNASLREPTADRQNQTITFHRSIKQKVFFLLIIIRNGTQWFRKGWRQGIIIKADPNNKVGRIA